MTWTWGAVVMVMVYSRAQVSGAHFNPAVTLIFTIFRHFPWKLVRTSHGNFFDLPSQMTQIKSIFAQFFEENIDY